MSDAFAPIRFVPLFPSQMSSIGNERLRVTDVVRPKMSNAPAPTRFVPLRTSQMSRIGNEMSVARETGGVR